MTKSLPVLPVIALLSLGALACGDTRGTPGSTREASSPTAAGHGPEAAAGRAFRGDGDADNPGDIDGDGGRPDKDIDEDSNTAESYNYHDKDDRGVLEYGHAADAAERRDIAAVVTRYYAAAAADEPAAACSLLLPALARSLPEDYGRGAGPSYMRGGRTCEAVMSRLFKHFHRRLASPVEVTGVRVKKDQAQALLGSTTMPASEILVEREAGMWKLEALLDHALE